MMEYLGAGGPVVNPPNVDKGIANLAMNIKPQFLHGKH